MPSHAQTTAIPAGVEAQRSLKTEQRALRGPEQLVCGMFEPDPFGAPARWMVLIYLVMSVAVFVYSAAN